jgi:hypothetical protein
MHPANGETYHWRKKMIDESAAKRIATALGWAPKREWVGLTEDEIYNIATFGNGGGSFGDFSWQSDLIPFMEAVEAKLKEKNT